MRQYQPIWNKLKEENTVSITVNRRLHSRILKAVVKEKWMDIGYKLLIEPKTAWLSHKSRGAILTFCLEIREGPITPGMLGLYNTESENV